MTAETPNRDEVIDEVQLTDFFAPLVAQARPIWYATLAITGLAVLVGVIYFSVQPSLWSAFVEFRPIFKGVAAGEYPNGLPFASTDIVDPTVLDQVYDRNHAEQFCVREEFRSGFVVDETSTELQFLDLDYQGRLSDTRLSTVDRERLQGEYRARRQALPVGYRLTWLRSPACRSVPGAMATKALTEVLSVWSADADQRRGVLKIRAAMLTPSVFDTGSIAERSLLIRGDLIRGALMRVMSNIREVELLPGAELMRLSEEGITFGQIRARVEDLVQVHLGPLIALAGRDLGASAVRWAEESLATALVQQRAAEERANAYSTALREYSGVANPPAPATGARPSGSSDLQTLTPQIDRTFIDRIVDLSETNTTFRQEMTRSFVEAKVAAVDTAAKVEYYRQLVNGLKLGSTGTLTASDVERGLTEIVADAKNQVRHFNALYEEFSKVSLRSGPLMYQVSRPPDVRVVKSFTLRSLVLLIAGAFFGTPVVLAIGVLIAHAWQRLTYRPSGR
jgi:hypothetical protein